MTMCYSLKNQKKPMFFVDENCHPQNIALAKTRGEALKMEIKVGPCSSLDLSNGQYCGVMVSVHQYQIVVMSFLFLSS